MLSAKIFSIFNCKSVQQYLKLFNRTKNGSLRNDRRIIIKNIDQLPIL
jgi:hypothetical protein